MNATCLRLRTVLSAVLLATIVLLPPSVVGQDIATAPSVITSFESSFTTPEPLPDGPLDQVLQVVELDAGAATPIHYHPGPGFATVLQGQVTHRRTVLDRDTIYNPGSTWVEIPGDVHWARDQALTPVGILATFIVPRDAVASIATENQLLPAPPAPTVPALARVAIATAAPAYTVTQLMATYEPGASTTWGLGEGSQTIVLVTEGYLTASLAAGLSTVGPGEYWVETSDASTTSWNATSSTAVAVVSALTPVP